MPTVKDGLDSALWHAGRNRYGEALQCLGTTPVTQGGAKKQESTATDTELVSYLALFGSYCARSGHNYAEAERALRQALQLALKIGLPEDMFTWVTRYNLGLAIMLGNRVPPNSNGPLAPALCGHLNEAIGILGTTAEALRTMDNGSYFREALSSKALALVAEALFMMHRFKEAELYAREAVPRLRPHNANALASRRLFGCYGIILETTNARPPAGGRYYNSVPPGTFNSEEFDDYVYVPLPYRPRLEE